MRTKKGCKTSCSRPKPDLNVLLFLVDDALI